VGKSLKLVYTCGAVVSDFRLKLRRRYSGSTPISRMERRQFFIAAFVVSSDARHHLLLAKRVCALGFF
jgi:hypothetical protein